MTDVDTEKARVDETRAAREEIMWGHPELSRFTNFDAKHKANRHDWWHFPPE